MRYGNPMVEDHVKYMRSGTKPPKIHREATIDELSSVVPKYMGYDNRVILANKKFYEWLMNNNS